jgi:PAS domain S-box-containing protein
MNKLLEDVLGNMVVLFDRTRSNSTCQKLIQSVPETIIALDERGLVSLWNPAAEALFGYTAQEVLGHDLALFIVPPHLRKAYYEKLFQVLQRHDIPESFLNHPFELKAKLRDNTVIPIEITLFKCTAHNKVEFAALVRDIRQRKLAEQELQGYTASLEKALVGISFLDPDGYYVRVNKDYASIVGYSPLEMIGISWKKTVPSDVLPEVSLAYNQMLTHGSASLDTLGITRTGRLFNKHVVMIKKTNANEQFIGHYCFMNSIESPHVLEDLDAPLCTPWENRKASPTDYPTKNREPKRSA